MHVHLAQGYVPAITERCCFVAGRSIFLPNASADESEYTEDRENELNREASRVPYLFVHLALSTFYPKADRAEGWKPIVVQHTPRVFKSRVGCSRRH